MILKGYLFPIILLSLLFSSCTIEDEFTELTCYEDFLLETRVVLKDPNESFSIGIVYYKTDGYNNIRDRYISYSQGETFSMAVKGYKKVGLRIDPKNNIDYVSISLFEIWTGHRDPQFHYYQEAGGPFTLMYDFETDTYEVVQE